MLEYLPLLLAFGATIVGIRGNTWNDGALARHRKITLTGWMSIIIAAGALSVAALQTRQSRNIAIRSEHEKRRLRSVAALEMQGTLEELVYPIQKLAGTAVRPKRNEFDLRLQGVAISDMRRRLDGTHASSPTDASPGLENSALSIAFAPTWARTFEDCSAEGGEKLARLVQTYSRELDAETIVSLELVLYSRYLAQASSVEDKLSLRRADLQSDATLHEYIEVREMTTFLSRASDAAEQLHAMYDASSLPDSERQLFVAPVRY